MNLAVVADKKIIPESTKNLPGSSFIPKLGRDINTSSGLRSVSFGDMKGHRKQENHVQASQTYQSLKPQVPKLDLLYNADDDPSEFSSKDKDLDRHGILRDSH